MITGFDYKNGQRSFRQIDSLMDKLLKYDESLYHAPDAPRPRMVPITSWVRPSGKVHFFPGGSGVAGEKFPLNDVMILGQDFDSLASFTDAVRDGYKSTQNSVARDLCAFLSKFDTGLPERAFFTNFCMGVRDADDQYGENPGSRYRKRDKNYMGLCDEMFRAQVTAQQPQLIVALGQFVPRYLSRHSDELAAWESNSFNDRGVTSAKMGSHRCTVVSLVHPANRHLNIGARVYNGVVGHAAEVALFRDALTASSIL